MAYAAPEQYFQQQLLPPTTIYMIRHGEPVPEVLNCYYGQMDVELGENGRCQSQAVAERLGAIPFDAVYSSDLSRACYLANLLGEKRDLPVRCLKAFRERHMGMLQGLTLEEMLRNHAEIYQAWRADRAYYRVPESENFVDLQERVVPAVQELARAYLGKRVAVVCHAGPIRVVLAHALGLPLENIYRLGVNHCSVHVLEFPRDDAPRVALLNG